LRYDAGRVPSGAPKQKPLAMPVAFVLHKIEGSRKEVGAGGAKRQTASSNSPEDCCDTTRVESLRVHQIQKWLQRGHFCI